MDKLLLKGFHKYFYRISPQDKKQQDVFIRDVEPADLKVSEVRSVTQTYIHRDSCACADMHAYTHSNSHGAYLYGARSLVKDPDQQVVAAT